MINKINFSGNIHIAKHLRFVNRKDRNLIQDYADNLHADIFIHSKKTIDHKSVYNAIIVPHRNSNGTYSDIIDTRFPENYKKQEEIDNIE